jgi:hypothetical protein
MSFTRSPSARDRVYHPVPWLFVESLVRDLTKRHPTMGYDNAPAWQIGAAHAQTLRGHVVNYDLRHRQKYLLSNSRLGNRSP